MPVWSWNWLSLQKHVDAIADLQSGTLDIAVTEPVHLVEDRGKGHSVVGWARFFAHQRRRHVLCGAGHPAA